MSEITDAAIHFEALKLPLKQDRTGGYVLSLSVHPDDVPDSLLRSPVGQRYMVAMVPLDGDESPAVPDAEAGEKVLRRFGAVARDPQFQQWMGRRVKKDMGQLSSPVEREAWTRQAVKAHLSIASATAIRQDPKARDQLLRLLDEYRFAQAQAFWRNDR